MAHALETDGGDLHPTVGIGRAEHGGKTHDGTGQGGLLEEGSARTGRWGRVHGGM
jgi:hypothetical protein